MQPWDEKMRIDELISLASSLKISLLHSKASDPVETQRPQHLWLPDCSSPLKGETWESTPSVRCLPEDWPLFASFQTVGVPQSAGSNNTTANHF